MATYIDCVIVPVPKAQLPAYKTMARKFAKVWLEHGALAVKENVADDVKLGKRTSFPQAVRLKDDEVVVCSWIVFNNRRHRDAVSKKFMADPRVAGLTAKDMPFDGKRMFWGGFKELVSVKA